MKLDVCVSRCIFPMMRVSVVCESVRHGRDTVVSAVDTVMLTCNVHRM